jgi:hypothetical protein
MLMLNPQPLPPYAHPEVAVDRVSDVSALVPRGCPGCTSGVFTVWADTVSQPLVLEWTVAATD